LQHGAALSAGAYQDYDMVQAGGSLQARSSA